ncbi:hypothetical protein ANCDUO_18228 [Ancylostoma duodenale]|uniref:Uncharacterized protein n=1 Tax=Ancylostoma duodenale TaxID=51022 RepID=A0A0C2CPH9_9BILA|nr:hypothetical protein ANCDUO_18228 [Ancylostoma duodenale]
MSATGRSPLIFVEKGTAINTDFYMEEVLKKELLPFSREHFENSIQLLNKSIKAILEEKACAKRYGSVDALKSSLKKTWEEIPQETLLAAVGFYTKCLKAVIKAKEGNIE